VRIQQDALFQTFYAAPMAAYTTIDGFVGAIQTYLAFHDYLDLQKMTVFIFARDLEP